VDTLALYVPVHGASGDSKLDIARHIILPFDLHENLEKFRERANRDLLFEAFPDTQMVASICG